MGWAQRRKDRVDRHREHLLAETQRQLEMELSSSSAHGASPVTSDAELDSTPVQDTPDSPVEQDSGGRDAQIPQSFKTPMFTSGSGTSRCRITRGSSFPLSSLTATAGRSGTLSKMTGIDGGRVRWSVQSIIIATWRSATWTVYKPILWKL